MEPQKEKQDFLNAAEQNSMGNTSAVLQKAAQRAAEMLGMTLVYSQVVTPSASPRQTRTDSAALQVVQIYKQLSQLMGDDLVLMKAWWHSRNLVLGATPDELGRSEQGREKIIDYLGAMTSLR